MFAFFVFTVGVLALIMSSAMSSRAHAQAAALGSDPATLATEADESSSSKPFKFGGQFVFETARSADEAAPADSKAKKLPAVTTLGELLNSMSSSVSANSAAVEEKAECVEIRAKLVQLQAAGLEFQGFATGIDSILTNAVDAKVAPLRVERVTDELARAEANIKLIRKVSKAIGLE